MTTYEEGDIQIEFEDDWLICKLDEHELYRHGLEKINYSSAVDFVCCQPGRKLSFVEIKDFRDQYVRDRGHFSTELWQKLAMKIRDSVSLIAAAYHRGLLGNWETFGETLVSTDTRLNAILWIETSRNPKTVTKRSTAQSRIKSLLSWLKPKTAVIASDRAIETGDQFGLATFDF